MALLPEQNRGLILLVNANQIVLNFLGLIQVGTGATTLLAGVRPTGSIPLVVIPWILRAFLIIPAPANPGYISQLVGGTPLAQEC